MIKDQNFELQTGDYQLLQLIVVNDAGNPYPDLEDAILNWYLYRPPQKEEVLLKTSVEDDDHYVGITVPTQGIVQVELLGVDTEDFDEGEYYHKLTATFSTRIKTAATGILTLDAGGSEYFRESY